MMRDRNQGVEIGRQEGVIFRAPFVVSETGPIIEDGAVLVYDGRIEAVARYADLRGRVSRCVELEQRILTPSLINVHTHMELSGLADLGGDKSFAAQDITVWIRALLERRMAYDGQDGTKVMTHVRDELRASGVSLIADIGNTLVCSALDNEVLPEIKFFMEFLGLSPGVFDGLDERLAVLDDMACTVHAPHTTHPQLISHLKQRALRLGHLFPLHVAESSAEIEFLQSGHGPFRDFIIERLGSVDFFEPPGCGAVEYLDRLGVLDAGTISVHAVHISADEAALLATRQAKVCLCPGSNRFLGVGRAPVPMLLEQGLKPCLGTDSLASNEELNLWREMQIMQEDHPAVDPGEIFSMATSHGAAALGRSDLGSLAMGKAARILAVEYQDLQLDEVYSYLVTSGQPRLTWLETGNV